MSADLSSDSKINLTGIEERSHERIVPKIRIRLRPQCEESEILEKNSKSDMEVPIGDGKVGKCNSSFRIISEVDKKSSSQLGSSITPFESSGDAVDSSYKECKINLRSRPMKKITKMKLESESKDETKLKIGILTKQKKCSITKSKPINSLCNKKSSLKTILLKSNKYNETLVKSENLTKCKFVDKTSKKSFNKTRIENMKNINLKGIVNQENFMKLSADVQWQLINFLPNCDKPFQEDDSTNNCQCSKEKDVLPGITSTSSTIPAACETVLVTPPSDKVDSSNSSNDAAISKVAHIPFNQSILQSDIPNLHFSVFNNEFFVRALNDFPTKLGAQGDIINLFNSERENLRSRPLSILNDDCKLVSSGNNDLKEQKCDSSISTTDTIEMTNIDKDLEQECAKSTFLEDIKESTIKTEPEIDALDNDSKSDLEVKVEPTTDDQILNPVKISNLCVETNFDNHPPETKINSNSDLIKKRRGRKRRSTDADVPCVPVKRSSRSTAGKRPSRLDSESPPNSPPPISEKKSSATKSRRNYRNNTIGGTGKQKARNNANNVNSSSSDVSNSTKDFESNLMEQSDYKMLKVDCKSTLRNFLQNDHSKNSRKYSTSPDSLPSQGESELSNFSKVSPNNSFLLNPLYRSALISSGADKRISFLNNFQTSSPAWSCTSESTTPSAKSDCGTILQINASTNGSNQRIQVSNTTYSNSEISSENGIDHVKSTVTTSTVNSIDGMPPPRQTLTLAAMREKMRAKKMAKTTDSRKDHSNSSSSGGNRKSSAGSGTSNHNHHSHSHSRQNSKQKTDKNNTIDDDLQLMERMLSGSEDFEELFKTAPDSLFEIFLENKNYEFESSFDQYDAIDYNLDGKEGSESKDTFTTSLDELLSGDILSKLTESIKEIKSDDGVISKNSISNINSSINCAGNRSINQSIDTANVKFGSNSGGAKCDNSSNNSCGSDIIKSEVDSKLLQSTASNCVATAQLTENQISSVLQKLSMCTNVSNSEINVSDGVSTTCLTSTNNNCSQKVSVSKSSIAGGNINVNISSSSSNGNGSSNCNINSNNNTSTNSNNPTPNAYLVDSNGLTTALSIIQSLNPGAKVTTQHFYLVNSGPQLILQPSSPVTAGCDSPSIAISSNSISSGNNPQLLLSSKPVLSSQTTSGHHHQQQSQSHHQHHQQQQQQINSNISNNTDIKSTASVNIIPTASNSDNRIITKLQESNSLPVTSYIKIPISDSRRTGPFLTSSVAASNLSQSPTIHPSLNNVQLQTITTPQQIGIVHSMPTNQLPSLFSSQIRLIPQPSPNTRSNNNPISLISSNHTVVTSISSPPSQPPKLLFICPTLPNNTSIVSSHPSVPNITPTNTANNSTNSNSAIGGFGQDQKYLLLAKQPTLDKPQHQQQIRLLSPQSYTFPQFNTATNIISQPNNFLVMQQPAPVFDSFTLSTNSPGKTTSPVLSTSSSSLKSNIQLITTTATLSATNSGEEKSANSEPNSTESDDILHPTKSNNDNQISAKHNSGINEGKDNSNLEEPFLIEKSETPISTNISANLGKKISEKPNTDDIMNEEKQEDSEENVQVNKEEKLETVAETQKSDPTKTTEKSIEQILLPLNESSIKLKEVKEPPSSKCNLEEEKNTSNDC